MNGYTKRYMRVVESNELPIYSDRAVLPAGVLSQVIETYENDLPHPMIFRITDEQTGKLAYVGVKEFTSPEEDLIVLPKAVKRRLEGCESVSITLVEDIPKATFLKIKPMHFYSEISNWKYFMEKKLNQYYTVLVRNETFVLEDNNLRYELKVEETNEETVCIIDTDVVLDMVPLNDDKAMEQLEFHKSNQALENIQELEGEIYVNELKPISDEKFTPQIFKIDIRKHPGKFYIQIEDRIYKNSDSAFNLDIVAGLEKLVSLENFHWTTMNQDFEIQSHLDNSEGPQKKYIEIDPTSSYIKDRRLMDEDDDDNHFIFLVPFAWETAVDVSISITSRIEVSTSKESKTPDNPSLQTCTNCNQSISKDKFPLHELFCLRNNIRCVCGQIFLKQIPSYHWHCETSPSHYGNTSLLKSKHARLYHQNFRCNQCEHSDIYSTFVDLIVQHKAESCPAKLHECRFCHLIVPQEQSTYQDRFENLTHHENECGNKTTECYKCSKVLKLKDLVKHVQWHELQKIEYNERHKILFRKCANVNCVNPPSDNDLDLCDFCYGPLYVSQLDPTNIKLQSRIERKYVIQLTKGCNNVWCTNVYCASGNPSSPWKSKPLRETLSFISSDLLSHVSTPSLPINSNRQTSPNTFWFCVNQSVSQKKLISDVIISEGQYDPELVYKAVSRHSDETAILDWLKNNAVQRPTASSA